MKCQLFVRCQQVQQLDYWGGGGWGLVKKELDIMSLRHNEVNFEVTFDDHVYYSKCSMTFMCEIKIDLIKGRFFEIQKRENTTSLQDL